MGEHLRTKKNYDMCSSFFGNNIAVGTKMGEH